MHRNACKPNIYVVTILLISHVQPQFGMLDYKIAVGYRDGGCNITDVELIDKIVVFTC